MMKPRRLIGFVIVCGWLSWTGAVHADAVTDWNAIAVQALATRPLLVPARSLSSIWPSSRPPSMTPSKPSTDASNPTT